MSHLIVSHQAGGLDSPDFVKQRLAERLRFPPGVEVVVEFRGSTPREGFAMARRAAQIYAGLYGTDGQIEAAHAPFVSDRFNHAVGGQVVGSQSGDGKRGWRIDWKKGDPKSFHINWWDDRHPASLKNKSMRYRGANVVIGGGEDLYYEVRSHFPGQVMRPPA